MSDCATIGDQHHGPPRRVADRLGRELAAMMMSGELASGDRLPPERALMQRFGVSRTAVREAITSLAARGLVLMRPGYRPIVRERSFETAVEQLGQLVGHLMEGARGAEALFELRILIEVALARHAALHATAADRATLDAALASNRRAIGDSRAFHASDVALHGALYRINGNPILPAIHKALVAWLMSRWAAMERSADVDAVNYEAHKLVVEAIATGDADRAEAAMRRHLDQAWELVRGTFGSEAAASRAAAARGGAVPAGRADERPSGSSARTRHRADHGITADGVVATRARPARG